MSKLLILITLFFLTYLYINRNNSAGNPGANSSAPKKPKKISKNLKPCAHCSLNVPESEGVEQEGLFFCTQAHANEHLNKTK